MTFLMAHMLVNRSSEKGMLLLLMSTVFKLLFVLRQRAKDLANPPPSWLLPLVTSKFLETSSSVRAEFAIKAAARARPDSSFSRPFWQRLREFNALISWG
jgi:hypothetical protein